MFQIKEKIVSNRKLVKLNDEGVYQTSTGYWNDTSPTSSVFSLGNVKYI